MIGCELNLPSRPVATSVGDIVSLRAMELQAPSRLLDAVAAFTVHRDMDALDRSLVMSLAELTAAQSVTLIKHMHALDGRVEHVIQYVLDGRGKYRPSVLDPTLDQLALIPLRLSMEHRESCTSCDENGLHRLIVPIVCEGRAIGALQLDGTQFRVGQRVLVRFPR